MTATQTVKEADMSTDAEFDCIVIGAGVQGSFTACELAKRAKKTLLLEQVRRISVISDGDKA